MKTRCCAFLPHTPPLSDTAKYTVSIGLTMYQSGGWSSANWSYLMAASVTTIVPILIIGLPLFDGAYAIIRRLRRGVSPFLGDRSHLYDELHGRGWGVRKTVLVYYAIQGVLVMAGLSLAGVKSGL